jgi:hypothetical protein
MIINRKSEALVETPRATRYLKQLCKHFVRVRVEYDDHHGSFDFGWVGICTMQVQPEVSSFAPQPATRSGSG